MSDLGLIVYCGTVPSTQDLAREILQTPPVLVRAVVAEHQTAGRGRFGHRWLDVPGESLLMTILLPLQAKEEAQAGELAFVLALAAAHALREQVGLEVQFRWSNDVLVNGRKLAGILIETSRDARGAPWALAGVGMNLQQRDFPQEIRDQATSVLLETGVALAVEPLAQAMLRYTDHWTAEWRRGGLPAVLNEWRRHDVTVGQLYRLPSGAVGVARKVMDTGEVVIEVDGQQVAVSSAEPVHHL
ncbi:MAG: biotin--[acetyl-CoA-carboxylase] ligase [Armatimonadota bacterium]|nr:biotin--[acetyl-CoA-carboxylase] ligase [Armatimonadota bacterium]